MGEAPGVDGNIFLASAGAQASIGEFVHAKLIGAGAFDLYGTLIPEMAAVG
jgi:hypothetical protein